MIISSKKKRQIKSILVTREKLHIRIKGQMEEVK